jgi:hypothetical protein
MGQAELRAVFKLINSPENKKVIDDNKGDIQRAVSQLGATANKGLLMSAFGNASASTMARNPQLFAAASDAGKKSGEFYSRGFIQGASKFGGGKDLAKVMALPDINDIGKFKGNPPPIIADVERERLKKMGLGIITAMFNPWIGSRLLSDAVGAGGGGKGGGVARGIFGAGGAAGFSEFYILITGIKKVLHLVMEALRWGADELKKAFQFSASLFAKSLESGLNLRFTALRQMTASTLGVDEKDVLRFAQSATVMRQLSDAANTLARNAPQLAYTAAQFKILEYNLLALGSDLATKLTPEINFTIGAIEKFANLLKILPKIFEFELSLIAPKFAAALKLAFASFDEVNKKNTFGQPQSFMKQLPVGAFEKMGLIIGGGMADKALEYQRRTATAVEKLYQAATAQNKSTSVGTFYMNRNPNVAGY